MSIETELNRKKRKLIVKKQKSVHRERINRLRARKGLLPLESSSSSEEEEIKVPPQVNFIIIIFLNLF